MDTEFSAPEGANRLDVTSRPRGTNQGERTNRREAETTKAKKRSGRSRDNKQQVQAKTKIRNIDSKSQYRIENTIYKG